MKNTEYQVIANDIKNELASILKDNKFISINKLYLPYFFKISNKNKERDTLKNYPITDINDAIEIIKLVENKGILLKDDPIDETEDLFLLLKLR